MGSSCPFRLSSRLSLFCGGSRKESFLNRVVRRLYEMGSSPSSMGSKILFRTSSSTDLELLPKILVLGCMDSGKTTLCRQLVKFSKTGNLELEYYQHTVQQYLVQIFRQMELQAKELEIELSTQQLEDFRALGDFRHRESLSQGVIEALVRIYKSGLYEACIAANRHMPIMLKNFQYFMKNVDRILVNNYEPTETDVLMSYAPTCGMSDYLVRSGPDRFRLIELPGHHIARRTWSDYYKGTAAVFFVVDLAELCDPEFIDGYLKDKALKVYKEILAHELLSQAGIIIFLNRVDIFEEKALSMKFEKLAQHIHTSEEAISYYRSQFLAISPKGRTYHHITNLVGTGASIGHLVSDSLTKIFKHNKENVKPV